MSISSLLLERAAVCSLSSTLSQRESSAERCEEQLTLDLSSGVTKQNIKQAKKAVKTAAAATKHQLVQFSSGPCHAIHFCVRTIYFFGKLDVDLFRDANRQALRTSSGLPETHHVVFSKVAV